MSECQVGQSTIYNVKYANEKYKKCCSNTIGKYRIETRNAAVKFAKFLGTEFFNTTAVWLFNFLNNGSACCAL